MAFPDLTVDQVQRAVPNATDIAFLGKGGQKSVFSCSIEGGRFALKFLRPNPTLVSASTAAQDPQISDQLTIDTVTARAQREVETLKQCSSDYLVKIGPIEITAANIDGEDLIYFTEELVAGEDLRVYGDRRIYRDLAKKTGSFALDDLAKLGLQMVDAIDALWAFRKIHRDIKPGNIMRRPNSNFLLLDMGMVFDLDGASYSVGPMGTAIYFSPEQTDFANRRAILDFRSDQFSLGLVLYEMATGVHPFVTGLTTSSWDVVANIKNMQLVAPVNLRKDLPESLNSCIVRLLSKRPALRYRKLSSLREVFQTFAAGGR